jgi:hypothetical protein
MTTKISLNNLQSSVVTAISAGGSGSAPKISSITYPGDDTAAATAGGQTITLTGSGFTTGASVIVNGSYAGVVTVVSNTSITFTAPANSGGTYPLYVVNTDGGTAISIPGISYSGTPSWSNTAGSLATVYETAALSTQLTATGNLGDGAITYSVYSGTLPPGSSLNTSTGLLSGTTQATASSTTYTFTIRASDAQNQDTDRAFSITINPDVVTWSSPADGTVTELFQDTAMSNVTLSATSAAGQSIAYTANALPTGVTISGSNVTGTPTVLGNTISVITATSANTNRTATRTFTWVVSVSSDPYFKNTTLLLNGEGTSANNGSNNNIFIDSSNNNFTITRAGNATQGSFSPYSVTGWSNYFDGTGDYLDSATNSAFTYGTGDFTIEFWAYLTAIGGTPNLIDQRGGTHPSVRPTIYMNGDVLTYYTNGGQAISGSTLVTNVWYHIALSRNSGITRLFVNGSQVGSSYTDGNNYTSTKVRVFSDDAGGTTNQAGYCSNLRILKGTGLYTSTFTPSTTPLTAIANTSLLTCQSNRFIDNSPNSLTLTKAGDVSVQAFDPFGSVPEAVPISYSNYFDGTGDGLTMSSNTALDILNGSYTIECWFNASALSGTHAIVSKYIDDFAPSIGYYISVSSTTITVFLSGSTARSYSFSTNVWYHLAVSVINNVGTVYVNGQAVGATFNAGVDNATNKSLAIGFRNGFSPGLYFNGHISNLRILKGTGLYTSNFTPSTTPLTAVANTSLLTCQSTTMIDNSTNNFTLTAAGDVKPRIFNAFGYTTQSATSYTPTIHGGSVYFDSTGDNLVTPAGTVGTFGTSPFTIEFWMYSVDTASVLIRQDAAGTPNWALLITSGNIYWQNGYEASSLYYLALSSLTTDPVVNAWTHVAITRNAANQLRFWINGIAQTPYDGDTNNYNTTSAIRIGQGSYGEYSNSYLSDVRITKGTAIYTSNFIPPTQKLTPIANTSLLLNFTNAGIIDQHGSNVIETLGDAKISTAVKKYGNASIYFDGSGDYLYAAPNLNYAMGSGDFTIEFWYYPVSQNPAWNPNIMGNYNATWTTNKWAFHAPHSVAAGKYSFWVNNYVNNAPILASTSNITNGAWVHLAITRSGSTWRMFVNGTIEATATSSAALDGGTAASMDGFYVGANFYSGEGGRYINAYIDDLRITKGYARYTANFTAPTAALTTK